MANLSIVIPLSSPLGFGSRQDDTELRYCLRSIEKHISGYSEIFIVGALPRWIQNVIHIPATDEDKTWNKEKNIFNKIMLACNDERVTEDFLFMNDDHYLLKDYVAGEFPNYCEGTLADHAKREDQYGNSAKNTAEQISPDTPYFDVHAPILFHKTQFWRLREYFDWDKKYGYCIKTLHCAYSPTGTKAIEYPDLKINEPLSISRIKKRLEGRHWFSIGNKAFEGGIMGVLNELYPKKSKYEK